MKDNNEQFENFIRDFDTIRMTNEEKNMIRDNLITFTNGYIPKRSPYYNKLLFFKKTFAISLIILLIISVSKPVSAKSLPGDLLYNVKIIHEEIESAMINKPEKKVDFEIKRTKTRIQEAVVLAKNNNLDKNKQKKLATDIKKHVKNISDGISDIKKDNPEKALALNSDLKTTLKVNSIALKKAVNDNIDESVGKEKINTNTSNKEYNDDTVENKEVEQNGDKGSDITTKEKDGNLNFDKNINHNNGIQSDTVKNEVKDENYTKDSSNLILDSISDDLEKTKIVSDKIEKEIISDEASIDITGYNEPDINADIEKNTEEINNETENDDIIDNKKDTEEINNETENDDIIDNKKDTEEIKIYNSQNNKNYINNTYIKTDEENIKNTEISESIQSEIISLENVLEAEKRLKFLLEELGKARDESELNRIKDLIEKKQLGKAYVEIQREVEKITEIKLLKELGIDDNIKTIDNPDMNTEINLQDANNIKEEI